MAICKSEFIEVYEGNTYYVYTNKIEYNRYNFAMSPDYAYEIILGLLSQIRNGDEVIHIDLYKELK